MRIKGSLRALILGLTLAGIAGFTALSGCATAPTAPLSKSGAEQKAAPADQRPVLWDAAVAADFERDVPRFVKALAKSAIEDMARERGSYFVDRALYEEALAKFKR